VSAEPDALNTPRIRIRHRVLTAPACSRCGSEAAGRVSSSVSLVRTAFLSGAAATEKRTIGSIRSCCLSSDLRLFRALLAKAETAFDGLYVAKADDTLDLFAGLDLAKDRQDSAWGRIRADLEARLAHQPP
jgi:hypothetical protein